MRNRFLFLAVVLLGACVAAGMVEKDSSSRTAGATRWDYGILRVDDLEWRERGRIVEQKTGPDFATAMNVPYSNLSDVFEINLLTGLGDQGWELVAVPRGTTYVFKRPR